MTTQLIHPAQESPITMESLFDQGDGPIPDERDLLLAQERFANRQQLKEAPLVGDWVIMANDRYYRVAENWGDRTQPSAGGSFCLHKEGGASMSGGLEDSIPKDQLILTEEVKLAQFWFPHHGYLTGGCAVYLNMPCPVYRFIPKETQKLLIVQKDESVYTVFADKDVSYHIKPVYSFRDEKYVLSDLTFYGTPPYNELLECPSAPEELKQQALNVMRSRFPATAFLVNK